MIRSVYIIGVGTAPVKVGVADDVIARLATLQIGNADALVLHHAVALPWGVAQQVEAAAHRDLAPYHRRGEWFNVTSVEARRVVEALAGPMIAKWRAGSYNSGDTLLRLVTDHQVSPWAFEALQHYRARCAAKDTQAVQAMNRAILDAEGAACLTAFTMFVSKGGSIAGILSRAPEAAHKALAALARGTNALCAHWRAQQDASLLDEIQRNVA